MDSITKDFTDKAQGFYSLVSINTTTINNNCPFLPKWLHFECGLHRYALATVSNLKGDTEYLRLGVDNLWKGKIFDYYDGSKHYISVLLFHPVTHQQKSYTEEFDREECGYQ